MTPTTAGHHPLSVPTLPGHVPGWTLRPAGSGPSAGAATRTYTASGGHDGRTVARVTIHRVLRHPLRGCYPVGGHDLLLELDMAAPRPPSGDDGRAAGDGSPAHDGPSGDDGQDTAGLLGSLVAALFAADPSCRRVTAAPAVEDTAARVRYAAGGFRPVAEADVREGTVMLMVAEPAQVTTIATSLSEMPH